MIYYLLSTGAQVFIFLAIVGAATLGVFAGIAMERKNGREWQDLKDERIATLEKSVSIRDQSVELYKQEAEFYKGLYIGTANPGATLNG